jgi:hypothetical protein
MRPATPPAIPPATVASPRQTTKLHMIHEKSEIE